MPAACAGKEYFYLSFLLFFTGQMSNIEDITCTDLEEYDRNLNHCKNCRRRQNTTDFDDIREEGHISHSQSFEG